MKHKTYSVYTLAELSAEARKRAIEDHRTFLGQEWDGDTVIEDAKLVLAFAGFTIDRIYYSGFWSQGDGACFTGSWSAANVDPAAMRANCPVDTVLHDIADRMAAIAARLPFASFTVKHSGRHSHEYCTEFEIQLFEDGEIPEGREAQADIDEKALIETARDAMRWIYRQLEKDYEWDTAEPQAIESIEANEYEFTEDGKID